MPDSFVNGTIFNIRSRPIYKCATELVGHINVCLVREVRYILPLMSRMRIDLTQKEIPLDGLYILRLFGQQSILCKLLNASHSMCPYFDNRLITLLGGPVNMRVLPHFRACTSFFFLVLIKFNHKITRLEISG